MDCPFHPLSCPLSNTTALACGGLGTCDVLSGTCVCQTGYSGLSCGSCAPNYMRVTTSIGTTPCVLIPGSAGTCSDGVREIDEVGVDCGGVCSAPCLPPAKGVPMVLIIAAVVLGLVVIIAITSLYLYCCTDMCHARIRPRRQGSNVNRVMPADQVRRASQVNRPLRSTAASKVAKHVQVAPAVIYEAPLAIVPQPATVKPPPLLPSYSGGWRRGSRIQPAAPKDEHTPTANTTAAYRWRKSSRVAPQQHPEVVRTALPARTVVPARTTPNWLI